MFNQVTAIGNLGSDPELKYTPSGIEVCELNIATTENWTDANGQKQSKTVWMRATCWRKLAVNAATYLKKGNRVFITARLEPAEAYINKDGQPVGNIRLTVQDLKFLTPPPSNGNGQYQNNGQYQGNQQQQYEPSYVPGSTPTDADIPF